MKEKITSYPDWALARMREAFGMRGRDVIWLKPKSKARPGDVAGWRAPRVPSDGVFYRYLGLVVKNPETGERLSIRTFAHNVSWFLEHDEWPTFLVDHRDGDGENNAPDNLRPATTSQNVSNGKKRRNNTSGVVGVSWDKSEGKWMAKIMLDRRTINLGRFANIEEAQAARLAAETKYHGDFARHLGAGMSDG